MTLKELYLADNKLGLIEATHLGTLLKNNRTLQVLDLSNNQIQDTGINHLVLGLCSPKLGGLEVLILWNNLLTSACSTFIEALLVNPTIHSFQTYIFCMNKNEILNIYRKGTEV